MTYEPLLSLNGVGQLDEYLHCWAGIGAGARCHIFEVDVLFQAKDNGLGDELRWENFRGALA